MRKVYLMIGVVVCFLSAGLTAFATNLDLAKDLYHHNLVDQAKEQFIYALYDPKATDAIKAECYYWLGHISFNEGRFSVALDDWENLIKKYPKSTQAKEISERLVQLREILSQASDTTITSSTAKSYLNNGDFWSGSDHIFHIDSSWLPNVEMAIYWYDRMIQEFPNTEIAEIAFQRKLFALIGWKNPGTYGSSFGLKSSFEKYMPQILSTFEEFEKMFPKSAFLQPFRYQIAQAYWGKKDWAKTREWLQKIIDAGNGESTFYTELAKARLQKVEY